MNPNLQALYNQVPSFQCKEGCSDCCGAILMSELEMVPFTCPHGCGPARKISDAKAKHLLNQVEFLSVKEASAFVSYTHRPSDPTCPCNECQFSRQPE